MKGLYFASRTLFGVSTMSPPDPSTDGKYNLKTKHQEEVSLKVTSHPKSKHEKVLKNSEVKHDSSTFTRCKKLISTKKYSAQDRLKRIRANVPLQIKIIDQVRSECNTDTSDQVKSDEVFPERSVQVSSGEKSKAESPQSAKYTADSRLKRIRKAFLKKISSKKPINLNLVKNESENQVVNTTVSVSSSDSCIEHISSSEARKQEYSRNESSMDVDMDSDSGCAEAGKITHNNMSVTSSVAASREMSHFANEICNLRQERAYLALHEGFAPDIVMQVAAPVGDVFVVVDTNIFLSHLSFVCKLITCDIPPYKNPIIVIPWLVLQEIDYASKKNDAKLSSRAKAANSFIYECLKKKHPRIFGQSLEDFKQGFKNAVCIDDYILQYCLKFTSLENNVILLTDDINLCNKSMVNHLSVFTKKEFQRNFALIEE